MHSEIAKLVDLARQQNWRVEHSGGHVKFYLPPGKQLPDGSTIYTSSSTPSSQNTIAQIKYDLEKAGLITSSSEWKKLKRRKKEPLVLPKLQWHSGQRPLADIQRCIQADPATLAQAALETQEGSLADDFNNQQAIAYLMAIMQSWSEWYTECICGAKFSSPLGLVHHMMKGGEKGEGTEMSEEGHQPVTDFTKPMPCELEPDFVPDPSLAIRCPIDDCKVWVFVTQGYLFEIHLPAAHGKATCTYGCGRVLDEWMRALHQDCCWKNPHHAAGRQDWESRYALSQAQIDSFAVDGKPAKWDRLFIRGMDENYSCVVKGPEPGTPYNAMPCMGACGCPVGAGRPNSALCERCDAAVDRAVEARRAAAESARTHARELAEKAAETPEKMALELASLRSRVDELAEQLEAALDRISDLERRGTDCAK